jgi:hypothetical protein
MTRPLKTQKTFRNPNRRPAWHSDVCSEDTSWVKIGNGPYMLSADGKPMPSRKKKTLDLSYFEQPNK